MVSVRCLAWLSLIAVVATVSTAQTGSLTGEEPSEAARRTNLTQSGTELSPLPPPETVAAMPPQRRADILMARKRYREAIEIYQEGIRDAAAMYNRMGIAYDRLAEFDSALQNYNMALKLHPRSAESLNNIGAIYYSKGDYGRAIKHYREALKLAPESPLIHSNLGAAYSAEEKYKPAFEAYERALALDPRVFTYRGTHVVLPPQEGAREQAEFYFYLAKTYARAAKPERALEYMNRALEEGIRNPDRIRNDPDLKALQQPSARRPQQKPKWNRGFFGWFLDLFR